MTAIEYPESSGTARAAAPSRRSAGAAVAIVFLACALLPIQATIGPLYVPPYRLMLLLTTLPCLALLLSGTRGRVRLADAAMLAYALWAVLSLTVAHGPGQAVESGGIYFVEAFGAYALARCCIRSAEDFRRVYRVYLLLVVLCVPVGLYESLTSHFLVSQLFGMVFPVHRPPLMEPRMGLFRAAGTFQHPILFGVFCAGIVGIGAAVIGRRRGWLAIGVGPAGSFFSLSAGPLVAIFCQFATIAWNRLTKSIPARWWILLGIVFAMYVTVDVLSNRSPVEVFISYLTFNSGSAYNRVLIWQFGTAEVARHPLFGIGMNEWENPWWMSQSMDNFWLYTAVHYGLPALALLALAILAMVAALTRLTGIDEELVRYRLGWMTTLCGLAIAGATVHFWQNVFCIFMFILGSAAWMLDHRPAQTPAAGAEPSVPRPPRVLPPKPRARV